MDMGSMRTDGACELKPFAILRFLQMRGIPFIYLIGFNDVAYPYSLTVTPTATIQETYSDNINLSSDKKQNAFVTELNPGVSIIRQSARSMLDFNYRMQNIYNSGGNSGLKTFNQLQYNSHSIFIPDRLFLDSRSSISQQNLNNNRLANDNISGAGNSTNVSTFGLSPYWTPHFSNFANGNFRANFDTFTVGSGATANQNSISNSPAPISDSANLSEVVQLTSGNYFKRINWYLSFNNYDSIRSQGDDIKFQNSSGLIRTHINKYFNVFAQAGYSNNTFQSINNNQGNGAFYTVGGQWTPSQHYSIEVGAGNNSHVTVKISPMQRLNWVTTYRDNSVGLNTSQTSQVGQVGQVGTTWETALTYQTRQSNWSITHNNLTTTSQQILLQDQKNLTNTQAASPIITQQTPRSINNGYLSDEVIVQKIWNASVSYITGKSTVSTNAYSRDSVYQISGSKQKATGLNATWNWKFASQTSAYLRPQWQQTEYGDTNNKDQYYDISVGLTRTITPQMNGRLEIRHSDQSSDIDTNNYQENRATASLFMRF